MHPYFRFLSLALLAQFCVAEEGLLEWKFLPNIPDKHGFAGPFAGSIDDNLVVAGGANFPKSPPWENGTKVWHNSTFVLMKGAKEWTVSELKLPMPTAYGLSFSIPSRRSIIMIGGSGSDNKPTNSAFEVTLENGKLRLSSLPDFPIPIAEASGAIHGTALYIFSGRSTNGTVKKAFRMEFSAASPTWEAIPWPENARGRVHSTAGVSGENLFLFAGRDTMSDELLPDSEDRLFEEKLDFIRDCYQLDPTNLEWKRLADLPVGLSAAPMNAIPAGDSQLLMLGGVTAEFVREQIAARPEINGQGTEHPGFSRVVYAYNISTNSWSAKERLPETVTPPVTVPVVPMSDGFFVIPSGEIKPGIRTTQVVATKALK